MLSATILSLSQSPSDMSATRIAQGAALSYNQLADADTPIEDPVVASPGYGARRDLLRESADPRAA
jgi:hypothetical protein